MIRFSRWRESESDRVAKAYNYAITMALCLGGARRGPSLRATLSTEASITNRVLQRAARLLHRNAGVRGSLLVYSPARGGAISSLSAGAIISLEPSSRFLRLRWCGFSLFVARALLRVRGQLLVCSYFLISCRKMMITLSSISYWELHDVYRRVFRTARWA